MRSATYVLLVLCLVPIQSTIITHVSVWGVRPDLCLVATCLVGFLFGRTSGAGLGIGLGFVQDLFSAGGMGLNLILKGSCGIICGQAAQTLSKTTPPAIVLPVSLLSFVGGVIALLSSTPRIDWMLLLEALRHLLVPQALYDGALAFGIFWLLLRGPLSSSTLLSTTKP